MKELPSWREVIVPHEDVTKGNMKEAVFAADLGQAASGEGVDEYRDPEEFFRRTYITEGMRGLLVHALRRLSGRDESSVIQLKTPFGGGKTHSMLALYHLMNGRKDITHLSDVKRVLNEARVSELPKVHVAVAVGSAENPAVARTYRNGLKANTLWGMIGVQLAESAGDLGLYEYIREADIAGTSPGSTALKELFDSCGSCLVLIDELVAYARKLYGYMGLPGGTFDNFVTFVQELTEAAKMSRSSLVVASIPQSEIELGGEGGERAQRTVEQHFGRLESIWKPVTANEGFEIVRRRLFRECRNDWARELVAERFYGMYRDNRTDFPFETQELEYKERIISCYPIHPEVFDRLYGDWATLEKFQRTRGVLRLMAEVIHELWTSNDNSALIMPGSIRLDVPMIREKLTQALPSGDAWSAIIDNEIDGHNSVPYRLDNVTPRFGSKHAARRVARTVMLGSAPTSRAQAVRGLEKSRVMLGVVQPDENIADFSDALGTLQSALAYLYSQGTRFWYDTRPTLRKTVEERAGQMQETDVVQEIRKKLCAAVRREEPFVGVHAWPGSSGDVPDTPDGVRLVVLGVGQSAAHILDTHGEAPRVYKNMLVFVEAASGNLGSLKKEVREYLAWKSIDHDKDGLNLDARQVKETNENIKKLEGSIAEHVIEAWCVVLAPFTDNKNDTRNIDWDKPKPIGKDKNIVSGAAERLKANGLLITHWDSSMLKKSLDEYVWQENSDGVAIKTLWEYLCSYCYFSRLANYRVLEETVKSGVQNEVFGYADNLTEDGQYLGLKFGETVYVSRTGYVVKRDCAVKLLNIEPPKPKEPVIIEKPNKEEKLPEVKHNFFMSYPVDDVRSLGNIKMLFEDIINHMTTLEGARSRISLEVNIDVPDGIPEDIIEVVNENCTTRKLTGYRFEE